MAALPSDATAKACVSTIAKVSQAPLRNLVLPQLAYAAHRGFAVLEPGTPPQLRYLSEPLPESQRPYTRFNDGACDRRGRFVAGTLFHRENPVFGGALYSYDPETGENKLLDEDGITVTSPYLSL